jgi:hypothetical protein
LNCSESASGTGRGSHTAGVADARE